jgi:ATP phosphoribosyltransferase
MNISSRLVVNKAAMKMKNQAIALLLDQLEKTLKQR